MLRYVRTPSMCHLRRASLRSQAANIKSEHLYEPELKDHRLYPEFTKVNVRLQGLNYAPLEKFQHYIHTISKHFGFVVEESYAVSAKSECITTLKPNSTVVEQQVELQLFDRWLQLSGVSPVRLQVLVHLLCAHLPSGSRMVVKQHEKADETYRYIPDLMLKAKQDELKSLDDPVTRRNLGWE